MNVKLKGGEIEGISGEERKIEEDWAVGVIRGGEGSLEIRGGGDDEKEIWKQIIK